MPPILLHVSGRYWGVCAAAGALGAVVTGLLQMATLAVQGFNPWLAVNLIASIFPGFSPNVPFPSTGRTLAAIALYLFVGALWGLAYGAIMAAFAPHDADRPWPAVGWGLGFGTFVWATMIYGLAPFQSLLNHAMNVAQPFALFLPYLAFGLVTAGVVCLMERRSHVEISFFDHLPHYMETPAAEEARVGSSDAEHRP